MRKEVETMARINIEDNIELQSEFWALLPLVGGDRDAAMGKLVRFFRLAQKHYGEEIPIPRAKLEEEGLLCMIESGWARPFEDGFQVKHPDDHFGWYRKKIKNGRKGGNAKAAASLAKRTLADAKRDVAKLSGCLAIAKPLTLFSNTNTKKGVSNETTLLWEHYSNALAAKKIKAIRSAKAMRILKVLAGRYGLEKSKAVLSVFLADQSEFVAGQAWQLGLLCSQEQAYVARAENGHTSGPQGLTTWDEIKRRAQAHA